MNLIQIDRDSPLPFYYQIEEWLRQQILSGILKPGHQLPSEIELSQALGVSRITVRQAFINLTNEGLLIRKRPAGTFVAYPRQVVSFIRPRLRGLTEQAAAEGYTVSSQVLAQHLIPATGEVKRELQLPLNTPVLEIRRLRSIRNIPAVVETSYHPYHRFPELLHMDLTDRSIYAILEQQYDSRPVAALDRFTAEVATKEIAHLLRIESGSPVMRYKRTARDKSGQIMEFTVSIYRADLYQFVVEYPPEEGTYPLGE